MKGFRKAGILAAEKATAERSKGIKRNRKKG